jgi:hypothetical protein
VYAQSISLLRYYTSIPIVSHKKPGLKVLPEPRKTFVLNTETTECLMTATSVNISSKFFPRKQAWFSVVAFLYETNYIGVSDICHVVAYKGGSARKNVGTIGN